MDRLGSELIDQSRVEYWRTLNHDSAATEDTELDPLDRRDRDDVLVGSYLKRNDDIQMFNGEFKGRVVGPGAGRQMVLVYFPGWFGDSAQGIQITPGMIEDRAPADPEEDPMPVFEEPE